MLTVKGYCQPVASFQPDRFKVCDGNDVVLTNTSTGATIYDWYINHTFYSSSQHLTATLYEPKYGLQPITLVARDPLSGKSDTITKVIEVIGAFALHLNADPLKCPGDTITLRVNAAAVSQQWMVQPQQPLIHGCDTCDSLGFVLMQLGVSVDLHSIYTGGCSQDVSYHYFNCNPIGTGIDDIMVPNVNLYPNPVQRSLTIELLAGDKLLSVELYNSIGHLCRRQAYLKTNNSPSRLAIDMAGLSKGVYHLRVQTTNGIAIKRVVLD